MSSGLECRFVEVEPGKWYYLLQDGTCPVQVWDWREYATAYGPFKTQKQAEQHLHDNHANPGGWAVTAYDDVIKYGGQKKWVEFVKDAVI